jgi:hypothetical protein
LKWAITGAATAIIGAYTHELPKNQDVVHKRWLIVRPDSKTGIEFDGSNRLS